MLENLLKTYDSLGDKEQISKIIDLLKGGESLPKSNFHTIGISKGAIELLRFLEIIEETNGRIKLLKTGSNEKISFLVFQSLFLKLSKERKLHEFINARNIFYDDGQIFVKNNLIPLHFSSIRNLLINFDLFQKDELIKSQFIIASSYQEWFQKNVTPLIEVSQLNDRPLNGFLEHQKQQEELGKQAEKFVLEYEKRQRINHPNVENIKIISEHDVGAGYDIQSYASDDSLLLDKFIEVKSYQNEPSFYWSANEVKTAKKEREQYYLYLVDRGSIGDKSYHPIQIKNPDQTLFSSTEWTHESDGYLFKKIEKLD